MNTGVERFEEFDEILGQVELLAGNWVHAHQDISPDHKFTLRHAAACHFVKSFDEFLLVSVLFKSEVHQIRQHLGQLQNCVCWEMRRPPLHITISVFFDVLRDAGPSLTGNFVGNGPRTGQPCPLVLLQNETAVVLASLRLTMSLRHDDVDKPIAHFVEFKSSPAGGRSLVHENHPVDMVAKFFFRARMMGHATNQDAGSPIFVKGLWVN